MSNVVNCKYSNYDVYIGRPSVWGNPFKIDKDGTRAEVIKKYEAYIRSNNQLLVLLPSLKGKKLGCWCYPKFCHGDVLIKLINELCNINLLTYD